MDSVEIERLIEQIRLDAGGAFVTGLAYLGDRLGLFRELDRSGATSSAGLAAGAGLQERYVREWIEAMAASGYVSHDPDSGTYWLSAEQSAVLVQEDSPCFGGGTFQFALPSLLHTEQLALAFRHGGGIAYSELNPEIHESIDRMHRPWFDHLLTSVWIPAMPGLESRLQDGVDVLDVGCGLGRSTVAMARAYPRSRFVGVDPHAPSLEFAVQLAAQAESSNARFEAQPLEALTSEGTFDLVMAIDCNHDMADPAGALSHIRGRLAPGGVFVWSEPSGSANPLENTNALGRLRAALSPYHCLTVSLAEGGAGLGTLIGESGARDLATTAGFTQFDVLPVPCDTQMFFGLRA